MSATIVYAIAKAIKTATGNPITVYWTGSGTGGWSASAIHAAVTADAEQAQQDADQWSDYWATKGYGTRAHVAAFTKEHLEQMP